MLRSLLPPRYSDFLSQLFPHAAAQVTLLRCTSPEDSYRLREDCPTSFIHLHPAELDALATYSLPKRRSEFLTGRLAARLALWNYLESMSNTAAADLQTIYIQNSASGRPIISGTLPQSLKNADLSISHSSDLACALIANKDCGIDIQVIRPSLIKTASAFCSQQEIDILERQLANCTPLERLGLLWSAKEACRKAAGKVHLPGFLEMFTSSLTEYAEGMFYATIKKASEGDTTCMAVGLMLYGNYTLAATILEKESHHA